jgi:hypothetical protein
VPVPEKAGAPLPLDEVLMESVPDPEKVIV